MFLRTCFLCKSYYRCARNISTNVNRIMFNKTNDNTRFKAKSTMNYMFAMTILAGGLTYAAVPLYRIFCQV